VRAATNLPGKKRAVGLTPDVFENFCANFSGPRAPANSPATICHARLGGRFPSEQFHGRIIFLPGAWWEVIVADWTKLHVGEPWEQADLFFLVDALARGMSIAEVAAFLRRTEEEVREQAIKHPSRPRDER
jgi:hypothetical protein